LSIGRVEVIDLHWGDQHWDINPTEFGFKADVDLLAAEAMRVGRTGNLLADFNARTLAMAKQSQPVTISNSKAYSFDHAKLRTLLTEEVAPQVDQTVQEAKLTIVGKKAKEFSPSRDGQKVDIDSSINLIAGSLLSPSHEVELQVETVKPKTSLAETNKLGINTLIAQGVSDFRGSPKNRLHNIKVGAAKFDGLIIAPGQLVSFLKELGPVDASTGYLPELVIKEDKTTPEFGGGLCQVSTTTFRAVLNGGLTINERRNHSYRVTYYEPAGTDATVYDPYPDFKFTNDTPGSILIHTYITGTQLHFDFYGTDTKRRVEMKGPFITNDASMPDPIYIDTSTLPPGQIKQIETAHRGASAILYRKVYDAEGKVIHDDTIKSSYIPWPAKYLRGVPEADKVDTDLNNVDTGQSTSPPPADSNPPTTT
jgi:vancomycin resistance protein YoaR